MKRKKVLGLLVTGALSLSMMLGCTCNGCKGKEKPVPQITDEMELRIQMEEEERARRQVYSISQGVPAVSNTGKVNDVFEYDFDISTNYTKGDQYSVNIVDMRVDITTPSGKVVTAYAFYKQDDDPTTPAKENRWAFRYSPEETGNYTFKIYDNWNSACTPVTGNFTAGAAGANSGRLTVQGNKFIDGNGDVFVPTGTNVMDVSGKHVFDQNGNWDTADIGFDVNNNSKFTIEGFIDTFKANNGNIIRTWGEYNSGVFTLEIAPSKVTLNGTERVVQPRYVTEPSYRATVEDRCGINYEGLGRYNLANASRMDEILQYANEEDFYINLTLFNQWSYGGNFAKNAYALKEDNAETGEDNSLYRAEFPYARVIAQGGSTNFWHNEPALKYQEQLVRYYAARYSAYRSLGIFEWWNEVDSSATAYSDDFIYDWMARMETYWDQYTPNKVVTSNSYAWKDHTASANPWENYNALRYKNSEKTYKIGSAQPHSYISEGKDPVGEWDTIIRASQSVYDGPVFLGEFGENDCENWKLDKYNSVKTFSNYYFAEGFWSPYFITGAAGGNMFWAINKGNIGFMPNATCRDYMKAFGGFINEVKSDLATMSHFGGVATEGDYDFGGYKSSTKVAAYVRDNNAAGDGETASYKAATPRTANYTAKVEGLTAGTYNVRSYNIYTGTFTNLANATVGSDGVLNVTVPVTRGVAIIATHA